MALSIGSDNAWTVYSGVLSGSGSLAKVGTGLSIRSTGSRHVQRRATTINAGTLQIGGLRAAGECCRGDRRQREPPLRRLLGNVTYSGVISGSGALIQGNGGAA